MLLSTTLLQNSIRSRSVGVHNKGFSNPLFDAISIYFDGAVYAVILITLLSEIDPGAVAVTVAGVVDAVPASPDPSLSLVTSTPNALKGSWGTSPLLLEGSMSYRIKAAPRITHTEGVAPSSLTALTDDPLELLCLPIVSGSVRPVRFSPEITDTVDPGTASTIDPDIAPSPLLTLRWRRQNPSASHTGTGIESHSECGVLLCKVMQEKKSGHRRCCFMFCLVAAMKEDC